MNLKHGYEYATQYFSQVSSYHRLLIWAPGETACVVSTTPVCFRFMSFFLPLPLCQVCHRVHSMYTSLHACFGDHFGTVTSEQEERMKGKLEWKLAHSPGNQSKREKEQQCSVVPLLVQIWLAPGRRGWWKERKENSLGKGGSQSPPESKVHYLKKGELWPEAMLRTSDIFSSGMTSRHKVIHAFASQLFFVDW